MQDISHHSFVHSGHNFHRTWHPPSVTSFRVGRCVSWSDFPWCACNVDEASSGLTAQWSTSTGRRYIRRYFVAQSRRVCARTLWCLPQLDLPSYRPLCESPHESLPERFEPLILHRILNSPLPTCGVKPSGHVRRCLVQSSKQILPCDSCNLVLHSLPGCILAGKPLRNLCRERAIDIWEWAWYYE